jgi:cadmium resistance protein CadD (predicted permease)
LNAPRCASPRDGSQQASGREGRSRIGCPTVLRRIRCDARCRARSPVLSPSLQIIGVATVAFFSTSIDNLGTLLLFFSARECRPRRIAAGYLGSTWIVIGAAWAASQLSRSFSPESIGYLGLVPIGLGIRRAWQLRPPAGAAAAVSRVDGAAAVALVNLAQNSDNLTVFTCLFADSAHELHRVAFGALAASAAAWCGLGFWLARRTPLAQPLRRVSRLALPFLLVAVGTYILADTATDVIHFPSQGRAPASHPAPGE